MKGQKDNQTRLTADVERFCLELVKPGVSQADAYRRAFPKSRKWTDKTVWEKASRLATEGKVRARVRELRDQITATGIMDATETLLMLSRVARADVRRCFRADDTLKSPGEIDDETAVGLLSIETVEEGRRAQRSVVRKVRMLNRTEALEKLARHHGLFEKDNRQLVENPWAEILAIVDGATRGRLPSDKRALKERAVLLFPGQQALHGKFH